MSALSDWDEKTRSTERLPVEESLSLPQRRDRAYLTVLAGSDVGEMFQILQRHTYIGRASECEINIKGDGISRKHARLVQQQDGIWVEDAGSTNGTFVNGVRVQRHRLSDGDKLQVGQHTVLRFAFHDPLEESFQRQMYESALRDGLTRIFNKKYFLDRLESEFSWAVRHHAPLGLVMFDVDYFKRVNDTYGHVTGDAVLKRLAHEVALTIRTADVFARYGGEEFAVICRDSTAHGALSFGERLRRMIEAIEFEHNGAPFHVTISVGVAGLPDPAVATAMQLVENADRALYRGKNDGRNRVVLYQPGM